MIFPLQRIILIVYSLSMTIAVRNKTRLAVISIAALIFFISALSVFSILQAGKLNSYKGLNLSKNFESILSASIPEFLQNSQFMKYSTAAVCFSIFACSGFSLIVLIYIYFTFKKTHAIEISFFIAFIFSIEFESLRLIFPLYTFSSIVLENIASISRLIYFFRLAGVAALFISSIFATKIITRQIFYVMFFSTFIAFSVIISIPINNFNINRYFIADIKYSYSYTFIILALIILTCINYFFVYIAKNAKEYLSAAAMIGVLSFGYMVLLYSSSFFSLIMAGMFFLAGTFFYIKNIHGYHLWE